MSDFIPISINMAGGPVTVTINVLNAPLSVGGVVWRYNSDKTFDGQAGLLNTTPASVSLGLPTILLSKLFLVEAAVFCPEDKRAVAYKVVITVSQNGKQMHSDVPNPSGSGTIKDEDIPFLYRFQLVAS